MIEPTGSAAAPSSCYEVYAIRYASQERRRSSNFLFRDEHDGPMPMAFFVWLLRSGDDCILVDTGFNEQAARERDRQLDCCPIDALSELGVKPKQIRDVVLTHLHYDHAGNVRKLPAATFHLQDAEMEFATGPCMCHERLRHAYSPDDLEPLIRHVYGAHVAFHRGNDAIRPGVELIHVGGHTKGLQVVRVRTRRGWIVLASDASHYYENMQAANPFPLQYSVAEALTGYRTCLRHADSADHVVPGHDPLVVRKYPLLSGVPIDIAVLHEPPVAGDAG
jgi:glyoxylase-like metal-dependent hydrolase (beta-lactamase superfamily II)